MDSMLIVDRIEQAFAACEDERREIHFLPLEQLPDGLKAGDCLREQDGVYVLDEEETTRRKAANVQLFHRLIKRPPTEEE